MTPVILFVFGAVVGSFLNVAALRLRSGLSLGGRSSCARCGHHLAWYELVPVLSFFLLGGRCRACRSQISWQYPLVELWTGAIFATIFNLQFTILQNALTLAVFCVYAVITVYDLRHKIIPDSLVYAAIILSLIINLSTYQLKDLLAGPILFAFFGALWLATRGRAIGFGDAKLALSVGLLLGAAQGFSAVIIGFWLGAACGLGLLLIRRKDITMKSELPFAPFLVIGAWASVILQADLLHVATHF